MADGAVRPSALATFRIIHDNGGRHAWEPAVTQGPVVVITGGTAGAGRAAAVAFAQKGHQVGLLARGVEDWRPPAVRWRPAVRCMAVATDVADADAVEDAASRIETGLGPIDVWVNSARHRSSPRPPARGR